MEPGYMEDLTSPSLNSLSYKAGTFLSLQLCERAVKVSTHLWVDNKWPLGLAAMTEQHRMSNSTQHTLGMSRSLGSEGKCKSQQTGTSADGNAFLPDEAEGQSRALVFIDW
jgi:hypothetical protein